MATPDPLDWIDDEAQTRVTEGLARRLVVRDRSLINFASNDYLGLASDPRVCEAAKRAIERFGFGSGASPLTSGWTEAHDELASELAEFEHTEAVALFPTGYAANVGALTALAAKGDAVYLDRLNHASLIDAARLSGATIRVFPHLDADRLESNLKRDRGRFRRSLIVTDGVFSMDGDLARLDELAAIAQQSEAILVVDEAHGTGVFGETGRGACEAFHVEKDVQVRVGTLSKALGSIGGFVAGSRRVVDHLVNRARTMIYSTALPPACVAAASESLRIVRAEPVRRESLHQRASSLRSGLRALGFEIPAAAQGPILPVIVGDAGVAVAVSASLSERGFLVPAIRPPTVPKNTSRLRISLTAAHDPSTIEALIEAFRDHRDAAESG